MKSSRLTALCLLLAASSLCAQDEQRKLVIAMDDWPPLSYEQDGKPKGASVETVSRIMKRLNVPFEMKIYPFTRSWMLAEKGKVDAIALVSYQPYREDALLYTEEQKAFLTKGTYPSNYLWKGEYVLFAPKTLDPSFDFKGYEDEGFQKLRIGVIKTYSYNEDFREAEMNRVSLPTPHAAMEALADGKVDLVPMEYTAGYGILDELDLDDRIRHLRTPAFSKPYHLVFTKNSDYPDILKISALFEAELAKMHSSGEFASISEAYLRPRYIQKIPRPLTFVCEEWVPFEYKDGDKVKGVDVAVVDRIMEHLGVPYKIEIYPWSRAWMMAEKGAADAVLSISYKESREGVLYYTDDQREFAKSGKIPENYLWMSEYVFFVMNKATDKFRFESYDQLKKDGVKIGRNRDYSYNAEFRDANFEGPLYATTEAGLLALVKGDIDLYPMDKTVGAAELARLGLSDSVTWLPKPLFSKPYLSPFCRKSDIPNLENIMHSFYRELRLMRENGTYDELYDESMEALKAPK